MTTLRTDRNGSLLVVNAHSPNLLTVIPDPTRKLGGIIRAAQARDNSRNQEKRS